MMREIKRFIIHCSATPPSMDIGAEEIRQWHLDRGWSDIGYHHVIRRDGIVEGGRQHETVGAHVKGHNGDSIGICVVGGVNAAGDPDCNFTYRQWESLLDLMDELMREYPESTVHGHREFANKACPCFDVSAWWI